MALEGSHDHQRTWERRLRRFEESYLRTLRSGANRYSVIPEAFPDDVRWPTRSVGTYCRDGLILARYRAEEDSFQFEVSADETIHEAARRLGAGDLRHKAPYARGAKGWLTSFSNFGVAIRDDDTGEWVEIHRPAWYTFITSQGFAAAFWTPELASERASAEIRGFVAAHLLQLDPAELFRSEVNPAHRTYDAYEDVVEGFRNLIESANREAPLQDFLRDHPALLTLEAAQIYPQFQLGNNYVTDFVLAMGNEEYILVEIEAATRPLYTRDGNPSADLTHAIQQVEDWRTWITTASEYIRQQLPGIVEPECWVVIGRRPDEDRSRARWARKQRTLSRIRLFTYDDLLDKAMRQLDTLRRYQ